MIKAIIKRVFLVTFLLALNLQIFSSDDKESSSYEFRLSINRPMNFSTIHHTFTGKLQGEAKMGFGLKARKIWFADKKLSLLSGFDFRNVNYYAADGGCGSACSLSDLKFNSYSISIPLLARYSIGKTVKFFIEAGPEINFVPVLHFRAIAEYTGDEVPRNLSYMFIFQDAP